MLLYSFTLTLFFIAVLKELGVNPKLCRNRIVGKLAAIFLEQDMSVERLIQDHFGSVNEQTIREWASASLESRKFPDTYSFIVASGKLINPLTGRPVEESINVNTPLDRLEMKAFEKIQDRANEANDGLVFWLSPPHPERSKQGKVIVSEVLTTSHTKELLNRSILFDTSESEFLVIANKINGEFSDNPKYSYFLDQVRQNPVFCNRKLSLEEWLPIIEKIINEGNQWDMVRKGEDFKEVERTIRWAQRFHDSSSLGEPVSAEGYVGNNDLSCPLLSPFGAFARNSLEGKFVYRCGKCRVEIKKVIFKGYKCSNCDGVYLGC